MNDRTSFRIFCVLCAAILSACVPFNRSVRTTRIAFEVFATQTAEAPTATFTPTLTPIPTSTHTPTSTATFTPTPTHTFTPTSTHTPTPTQTHTPAPTSTDTPTLTPTPSATPTLQPTATSTPGPDLSAAVLRLEDLPAGFEEERVDKTQFEGLPGAETSGQQASFAFMRDSPLQMITGVTLLLPTGADRAEFDEMLPFLLQGLALGISVEAGETGEAEFEPIEGMEDIGDASGAIATDVNMEGIDTCFEVAIFRESKVGAILFSMYLSQMEPSITMETLAQKLDARIVRVLTSH